VNAGSRAVRVVVEPVVPVALGAAVVCVVERGVVRAVEAPVPDWDGGSPDTDTVFVPEPHAENARHAVIASVKQPSGTRPCRATVAIEPSYSPAAPTLLEPASWAGSCGVLSGC
jgi:hypothetical protein